jgi:hypothetical protein
MVKSLKATMINGMVLQELKAIHSFLIRDFLFLSVVIEGFQEGSRIT